MFAFATLVWEMRKSLLEGQPKHFDVNIVTELLRDNKEEVAKDKSSEKVYDVGTPRAQCHRSLVQEDKECEKGQHVQLQGPQLLKDNIQESHMQSEMHII